MKGKMPFLSRTGRLGAPVMKVPHVHACRVPVPSDESAAASAAAYDPTQKQKSQAKTARIPIKIVPAERLKKPEWIRVKAAAPGSRFYDIKRILREHNLHTVCEEASCPNIGECFGKGTATFMIMGDKCTRRCPSVTWATDVPIRWTPRNPRTSRAPSPR